MIKDLLKKIFLSEISYTPRFITRETYKKSLSVNIDQDTNDYKIIKENFNSLPLSVRSRYAYVVVSAD